MNGPKNTPIRPLEKGYIFLIHFKDNDLYYREVDVLIRTLANIEFRRVTRTGGAYSYRPTKGALETKIPMDFGSLKLNSIYKKAFDEYFAKTQDLSISPNSR